MVWSLGNIIKIHSILLLGIVVVLSLLAFGVKGLCNLAVDEGVVVSVVYSLIFGYLYVYCWKKLAEESPKELGKYYLVAMVLRLMSGLLIVLAYCLIVREREPILGFTAVFSVFYIAMIIFDTAFFAIDERMNLIKERK